MFLKTNDKILVKVSKLNNSTLIVIGNHTEITIISSIIKVINDNTVVITEPRMNYDIDYRITSVHPINIIFENS